VRTLGLDLGKKTIGVAVSDPDGRIALPVRTIKRSSLAADLDELEGLIKEYGVRTLVVGMPLNMDGTKGPRAAATEKFIVKLQARFGLPVVAWDERLSTVAVTRVLADGGARREKRREAVDNMAASYILQGYLDSAQGDGEDHASP